MAGLPEQDEEVMRAEKRGAVVSDGSGCVEEEGGTMRRSVIFVALVSVLLVSGMAQAGEQINLVYGAPTGSTDWKTVRMLFPVFEALYPNVKVKDVGYPRAGYEERLLAQFAAKSSEVDFFTEWAATEEFADREVLVPMDGSVDPNIKISDELRKKIYPSLVKMFTYPQFPMPGRSPKLYMMPINSSDAMVYIYREDLIKDAGFAGPPKSWDDRIKYGQKLTRDINGDSVIDIYGDVYQGSKKVMVGKELVESFVNALWTSGGEFLDAKGMPAFNSEAGVKALQYLSDLKNKHKTVPPGIMTYTFADVRDLLASGKVAMGENWVGYWKWMDSDPASQVRGKVMITPIPYLTKPGGYTHAGGLGIPLAAKNRKEAWEYIKFMMMESTQTLVHLTLLDITALPSVAKSAEVQAFFSPRDRRAMSIYDTIAQHATPLPLYRGSSKVLRVLGDQVERALEQQATPKEALDAAAVEARKIIQEELGRK
jgi:multiple sugar transport system substrate-binding protein